MEGKLNDSLGVSDLFIYFLKETLVMKISLNFRGFHGGETQ